MQRATQRRTSTKYTVLGDVDVDCDFILDTAVLALQRHAPPTLPP